MNDNIYQMKCNNNNDYDDHNKNENIKKPHKKLNRFWEQVHSLAFRSLTYAFLSLFLWFLFMFSFKAHWFRNKWANYLAGIFIIRKCFCLNEYGLQTSYDFKREKKDKKAHTNTHTHPRAHRTPLSHSQTDIQPHTQL